MYLYVLCVIILVVKRVLQLLILLSVFSSPSVVTFRYKYVENLFRDHMSALKFRICSFIHCTAVL